MSRFIAKQADLTHIVPNLPTLIRVLSGEDRDGPRWYPDVFKRDDKQTARQIRRALAAKVAFEVQQTLLYEAHLDGLIDAFSLDSIDQFALWEPRTAEHAVMLPSVWKEAVPLVLVASRFSPHASLPRVTGNVIWIEPGSGSMLVAGLVECGWLSVEKVPDDPPF